MAEIKKRFLLFAILFLVLIVSPVALNKYYNYQLEPKNPSSQEPKIFVINPGQPLTEISVSLKKENLIKNAFAFRMLVSRMNITKNIQAGDFRLSADMTSRQIAEELTHGAIDVWITLPEGLRIEEQAEKIEEKLKFGSNETYQFDKKEFLKTAEEGYMFPDTYLVPKDSKAQDVASRLIATFLQKTEDIITANKTAQEQEEIVILASLIEREANTNEEKPIIAGILKNRLDNNIALQVDATVQYAKGYDSTKKTWWPQITQKDYRSVKSQFNTYLFPGLPPKPISNPGLESIKAAANPADTPYMYYLHDSQGQIHYATTGQEHNQNIEDFL